MLKLALDFSSRALKTLRQQPIASQAERWHCEWTAADLAPDVDVAGANDPGELGVLVREQASRFQHSRGRAFTDHLDGVGALLSRWSQPALVVQTGLYHSAYSTQQYPYGLYSYTDRDALREVLGRDGERLVFLFCSHDRVDLYAQAVALAERREPLPEEGLTVRNALTGGGARIPRELLSVLLRVHAADLMEQMDGFNPDLVHALLSVLDRPLPPWVALYEAAAGADRGNRSVSIRPRLGTFGLAPALGLGRPWLPVRLALSRLLEQPSRCALSEDQLSQLARIEAQHPYLLEVPWLRLIAEPGLNDARAAALLARVRSLYQAWGVPWLKRPFDGNSSFQRLVAGV